MRKIPTTSQLIPLEGLWFIFKDGDREIAAHNSHLAKESIFINGEIVSENRSLNRVGKHQFMFEGNEYEVVFDVSKIIKCEMECSLFKNNLCIGKFKTYYKSEPSKISYLEQGIICFLITIFANSFAILFQIPIFFPLITGLSIFILVISKFNKGSEFTIEEINV